MQALNKKAAFAFCALWGAVSFAYSNHFGNSFHFDDSHTIVENSYIRDLHNLPLFFTDTRTFSSLPANRSYRPLVTASLAIDYALAHGLNSIYFQASTFFWFLVQLLLMYALFRKVGDMTVPDPRNRWMALFAVALYGLHPAIAETVNYVIQRGDVYSTLGVIAGLVLYMSFPQWRKFGLYLIPVAAALLSKPPALAFPAILFVYIRLFEEKRLSRAFIRCVPALLAAGAAGGLILAMTPATFTPGAGSAHAYRMTQPLVALRYFRNFFVPNRLSADSDLRAVKGMFDGNAWLGVIFVLVLIAVAVACSKRRDARPIGFGIWWFLLGLMPTSIFPLAEVENDHRLYLPFAGLVLAVCWPIALRVYARRQPLGRSSIAVTAAVSLVILSAEVWGARRRNEVWRTDESLWLDVTLKSPRNGRGLMNYGLTQMEKGEYRRALNYFERAAEFTPNYSILEVNLGIVSGELNQDAAAEQHFARAIALAPNTAESHYFYARWLKQKNRLPEAAGQLQQAIAANPDYIAARYLLMEVHAVQGDWAQLRTIAENTLQRFPSDATAADYRARANAPEPIRPAARTPEDYLNLSLSYCQAGKFHECLAAAREALKLRPKYAEAYNNIAAAYEELRMWDEAIEAARQAVIIRPDFQLARNNLAWAEEQKRKTGARK